MFESHRAHPSHFGSGLNLQKRQEECLLCPSYGRFPHPDTTLFNRYLSRDDRYGYILTRLTEEAERRGRF